MIFETEGWCSGLSAFTPASNEDVPHPDNLSDPSDNNRKSSGSDPEYRIATDEETGSKELDTNNPNKERTSSTEEDPSKPSSVRQRKQAQPPQIYDFSPSTIQSPSQLERHRPRTGQQQQPSTSRQSLLRFDDHFTLRRPSSSVTFRGESIHVYELRSSQVQMKISKQQQIQILTETEKGVHPLHHLDGMGSPNKSIRTTTGDDGNHHPSQHYPSLKVELKDVVHDKSMHISLLRLTYTTVALFCMATFFCFSFLVILFLFMDLLVDAGLSGEREINSETTQLLGRFLGVLFAIPNFLYGFSSLLTVWGFFVSESFHGFPFLRTIVTGIDEVLVEWASLIMMLGVPLLTLVINLFRMVNKWWENTIFVWYISVSLYFTIFTFIVVCCEVEAAWLIVHKNAHHAGQCANTWYKIKYFVGHAIKRTQEKHLCGYKVKTRIRSDITDTALFSSGNDLSEDDDDQIFIQSRSFWRRWYTKITLWKSLSMFYETIDRPEKICSMDDVVSNRRFVTRDNWSLEKSLCSSSNSHNVVVVNGPAALKRSQIISTVVVIALAVFGLLLVVLGALRWLKMSMWGFLVFLLIIGLACFPKIMTMWRFLRVYRKHIDKEKKADDDSDCDAGNNHVTEDGIYQTFDTYRVSRPRRNLRIAFLVLHYGFLYLFPIVSLIFEENYPVLALFILVSIWSSARYWFDPVNMLHHNGNLDPVKRSNNKRLSHVWKDKSRISSILLNVTRSEGTKTYIRVFLLVIVGIFTLAVGVIGYQTGQIGSQYEEEILLTPRGNFVYPPQLNLKYPTCKLVNNANILNSTETTLIDYTFLTGMIYQKPNTQQETIDEWFGPGVAELDTSTTSAYRKELDNPNLDVNYDIVLFGDKKAVIAVKGSATAWEWLTDAQLWAAVGLMEIFLSLLPAGGIFNSILDEALQIIGCVESKQLREVQLDKQTTGLVKFLKNSTDFNRSLSITGHSLGGGIALITGAHTHIPAISISGPNNIYSRKTFDPHLNRSVIDTLLFNVIPENDPVPMLDKPGLQTQHVKCTASSNNFWDCHWYARTLCELMVACGSFGRPPPCECAVRYGYPEPKQIAGNRTFSDICGTKRTNDGKGIPFFDE